MELMIEDLMEQLIEMGGSDLHLSAGLPPYFRISGHLTPIGDEPLTSEQCQRLIFSMLNNTQRKNLEQNWELDCSYGVKGLARFRVNVYKDRGTYAACLRALSSKIPSFEKLGLPDVVREMAEKPRGLILVTGPTGSGKTTTLAAMIDLINRTRAEHILTIEDPIEFVYEPIKSLIHQRQLGEDTKSFSNALRAALREDPDIVLVGEMRDLETISLAISAAETGHLVFATLHTSSASQTVDRMVDVFPSERQQQVRVQLSNSLVAVFSQTLVSRKNPKPNEFGRVMAQEIMIVTPAIANLIREGKTAQIYSAIQTGGKLGMQTLERVLADQYKAGLISFESAMSRTSRPDELQRLIGGTGAPIPTKPNNYAGANPR
ncbi:type IV pilus twitching motility protein PilT [Oculatella sp. FACHB-28]|uniref:type IV pilus twitching motility protein PilT n=1 Tax=Cyanophyceae TaxID=3028117 RepID=UPI00168590F8|nr:MULTISPECIES: type IV pilus twitching motility protein PilT [Cyanophyceae]MBD1866557.1 type IV pilus twitching motility protein PilT [Cyanobacteria bacterium FACHB-471]MBD2000636.1 type IV pilus twitching motility protein PilT [Leptolyngbya sp. FACHB-541]MBD2056477.1 type IV pilus twitching motility protein PilT [Oculatella sp. FACHB-28]MBD2070432.1 type IV pilus twitching motility protein PilT [Leptolyngbya sp. FACHB-671]